MHVIVPPIEERTYTHVASIDSVTCFVVGKAGIVLKTTDGGTSWKRVEIPEQRADLYGAYFTDRNRGVLVGPHGLILATADGGNHWSKRNSSTTSDLVAIRFLNASIGWIVGFNGMILRTTDGGKIWKTEYCGVNSTLWSVSFINPKVGWAGGSGGTIVKTTDGGLHWRKFESGVKEFVYTLHFLSLSVGWAAGGYGMIIKTTDGGASWTRVNVHEEDGASNDPSIFGYSSHFFNDHEGLISGSDGTMRYTNDDGKTFRAYPTNTGDALLSLSFANRRIAWAVGTRGSILKTSDGGATWINQSHNAE